ncbi:MAG TPA: hypothetical protein VFW09_09510 [Solirubrobacteraceae bacterium]|nr:hypothetical protein [Solirubrobacteraceae bacterium]
MRCTARIRIASAIVAVVALVAVAAAPADASGRTHPGHTGRARAARLALVSPANDARLRVVSPTLVVRLRTNADFRARLNGRNVTARFGRPVRGIRTARFVRGRDFRLGRGTFMAATGRRGTHAVRTVGFAFTAWRRDPRPMRLTRRRNQTAGGGEMSMLSIDVVSDAKVTSKRIWVNGKPIRDHLLGPGDRSYPIAHGCGCHLDIGANHGLRFGANKVTAQFSHPGWTFQRTTKTFWIARNAPLVGAGQDRYVAAGRTALLNGSSTKAARPGMKLIYRWRIVSAPKHARVRLVGARRVRARLIARTRGDYRVRLAVNEVPRGGAKRAAAAKTTGASADDVDVGVAPTDDPMGVGIQTITNTGAIYLGAPINKSYPIPSGEWMQILVLNQSYLTEISDTFYTPQQMSEAKALIDGLNPGDDDIVIVSVPQAQNLVYPTRWSPNRQANFDYQSLTALISEIGGVSDTPDGWAITSNDQFSVIGQKGLAAGQAWQNVGASEAGVYGLAHGTLGRGRNGSLNGYMQDVAGNAYSFVSPEYVPIDTQAPGSDAYTHNTITVGSQTFNSATIANGDTGAQLVVLNATGALTPVAQTTYTIIKAGGTAVDGSAGDPANGNFGTGVKGLASTLQYFDRTVPTWDLVILQTFGQAQWWGNTPNGSPSWANDNVNAPTFGDWGGNPFVSPDGTDNPNNALYNVWNPGYPTVAGQIGSLTSGAGHDTVAGFGVGQNNNGTPNGGLTVVASTHPYDGRLNFFQGQTGTTKSAAQMVGTLTRTKQGQWTVQTASPSNAFSPSRLWQTAFANPQPWPYTNPGPAPGGTNVTAAEAKQYQAAMQYIAGRLWPTEGITDVRPQYVLKKSAAWDTLAGETQNMPYPGDGHGFTAPEFTTLQNQLVTEMGYVHSVQHIVNQWQSIFTNSAFDGYVNLQKIARGVFDNALANAEQHANDTTSLNWLDVGDYSLEVAASIIGFTPASVLAEPMGLVANVLGLASASLPSEPGSGASRADSQAIWDRADLLAGDLVTRFNNVSNSLSHLEDVFFANWAKLQAAGQNANGSWAFGTQVQTALKQSLAVTTARQFYEALLPLTYTEWVINPNATGAENDPTFGGDGRALPGRGYRCWGNGDPAYPSPPKTYPFANSPDGALHWGAVHGWSAPGSDTWPAAANQTWYEIRVLKSSDDPMQVINDYWRGNNPTIWEPGADPPASLVNGLFEPINPGDTSGLPTQLGMNKTDFFGDYGNGWGWRKAMCS